MTTHETTYPALANLLGGYLHQDWDLEHEDVDGVLDGFVAVEGTEAARAVADDVDRFVRDNPHETLSSFERAFRPDIIVGTTDEETSAWLIWLRTGLQTRSERDG